jgi:MYXO-CTERM domain-containing protein
LRGYLPYGTPLSTHGTDAWSASLNGDWHDHTIRQGKFAELSMAADAIGADHAAGNAKPAINDENGYDPNESSTEDVLEGIAGSLAGGGYGSTGHKTGSKQGGYFWGHAAVGATIDVHPSRLGLRFMRESVDEHVRFWRMMPKAPNQSIFAKFSSGFRVLEWSGEQYLLASDAAAAGEAHLPSGTWRVLQFDVVNTERDTLSESASGTFAFTTPASRAALTLFVRIGGAAERPDEGGGSGGSGSGGSDSGDGSGDGGFGGAGTAGTSGGTNGPSGGAVDGSGGMSGASASNGAEAGDGATDDAGCACRAARVSDLHAGSLGLLGLIAALRRRRNRSLRG